MAPDNAYLEVPDPDAPAAEFTARGVTFSIRLKDTSDGLRGFELRDSDGYVLFFGCPIPFAASIRPRDTTVPAPGVNRMRISV